MTGLDDTNAEILGLLMEDSRRSYTEIGEQVGLSTPSVSNRVSQLRELGIIEGFTVDVDRSMIKDGDAVLIEIEARPGRAGDVVDALSTVDSVEHVFQSVDPRITVHAYLDNRELERLFTEVIDDQHLESYEVRKVARSVWNPQVSRTDLALECAQCGKSIEGGGVTVKIEERRYSLCCPSCESLFREQYQEYKDAD